MATGPPLRKLIDKYLDGAATDAEVAELGRRLREDPAAADAFARLCRLDAWLAVRFREEKNGQHFGDALWSARRHDRRFRGRRLLRLAAGAVAAVVLASVGWAAFAPRYPRPHIAGAVSIRGGGVPRRGAVVEATGEGAALTLGGYCHVELGPYSVVRLAGRPWRERVILERGRVVCEVERRAGEFAVETELCTVAAEGTRFAVELLDTKGGLLMFNRHVLVKVFAGAVVVAAAGAQEVVKAGEEKLLPGKVVVTAESLNFPVGGRRTFAFARPDGEATGELDLALVGTQQVGDNTLSRVAVRFGATRINDLWIAVGADGHAVYDAFGADLPQSRYPLPLKEGMSFEYESTGGKVRARVARTEAVQVPAGKFACLVLEREREANGRKEIIREWIAPALGTVKVAGDDFVMALSQVEPPPRPKPEQGVAVLSTFDTGEPLRSPLFARARWGGWKGDPRMCSDVEIDPFTGGAEGTPFCMRWTYTTLGTWVSASISPGGREPVDLSNYKGISFYVKGLLERRCTLTIQAKGADGQERAFAHIPVAVTREWRKVIITPQTHPELRKLDLSKVYSIGLTDAAKEGAAHNVVWLDQVKLHEDPKPLIEEIKAMESVERLLKGKKPDF